MSTTKVKDGLVHFNVWAPKAQSVTLHIVRPVEQKHIMTVKNRDYYELFLPVLDEPYDYYFVLNNELERPDPGSKWQPEGVYGPSRTFNPRAYKWTDKNWHGISLKDYIIYELHIGTFTPEGTFESAISKLPYLKDLGITAIEIMPISNFPGNRNWGYDGVFPYAPQNTYGGPLEFQKLIDAAHSHGIAVILDAVYNHLGPEANCFADYGHYFNDQYTVPWGDAINYDGAHCDAVRDFFIKNALYWLEEFHIDGLRLDAVDTIFDVSARHFLADLSAAFHHKAKELGKKAYLFAEAALNAPRFIRPLELGGYGLDCQWNDEFHHALHTVLTNNNWRYFADYGKMDDLRKAIKEGFVHDGKYGPYRKKSYGASSKDIPGENFLVFCQNHDQIANACFGLRIGTLIGPKALKLASCALLLCVPCVPMLFMGEEWDASTPFHYFTSFESKELVQAVREGYIREFEWHTINADLLDPQDDIRFDSTRIKWTELDEERHKETLKWYKALIALRKKYPCFHVLSKEQTEVEFSEENKWMIVRRGVGTENEAAIVFNMSDKPQAVLVRLPNGNWNELVFNKESGHFENADFQASPINDIRLEEVNFRIFLKNGTTMTASSN